MSENEMDKNREHIKEIFFAAYKKKTPQERSRYLDKVCGSDSGIRREVESLLKAHGRSENLLKSLPSCENVILEDSPLLEASGTVIDHYKLLEKIGEGGMAVVYMAEQEKPIRRKVALKIIKLGMDTKQVIARFEAERQALAMMDHPNIAKVLDAGTTDTGRPYFVMELVTGISITDYCDQNNLDIKERLALFLPVCNAIQHAHQKGIIHRDIKPSNVMVTQRDGIPVPKVIDFGIAKAINQRLTEKTLFTRYAHIIGTPAYMSPEQAELSDLNIDTRSDIYSLGVLLYELLTGTTPFSEEELRQAGYVEMTRIIREQEPPRPSTRLTEMFAKSNSRHELSTLHSRLSTDLDCIAMKSLDKDRTRRYDTASALALDIQRHLGDEPVLARAPGRIYCLQKFLRRHRSQTAGALALLLLVSAMMVILYLGKQNQRHREEAEESIHRSTLSDARLAYAKGDLAGALKIVKPILPSEYIGSEAHLLYAGILVQGRQPEEAVTELENLINKGPKIAGAAHALWGRMLLESNALNTETALQEFEGHQQEARDLLPKTAEAYFLQAMTSLTIKEKLELLDEALRLDPGHYESCRLRALTYYASKKYEKMQEDARVMAALDTQDPLGHSLYAIALRERGHYEDANEAYDSAIRVTAKEDPRYIEQYVDLNAQRCDTLMAMGQYDRVITDAQQCLDVAEDALALEFRIFCARTALGDYDKASAFFSRITDSDLDSRRKFRDWSTKYVFDTLDAGRLWHPPGNRPEDAAFLAIHEAEETYHRLRTKAKRLITGGFNADWSPDGTKLVFCLGVPRYSGVAIYDLATQEVNLLIAPGKNPKWSPDGRHIAFVRQGGILDLSDLTTVGSRNQNRSRENAIWVMGADGTEPRCLSSGHGGGRPSWSQDSKHVYCRSRHNSKVFSVSIENRDIIRKPILICPQRYAAVSPDGTCVALVENQSLKIVDIASQSPVADWAGPLRIGGGNWDPTGHEFSLGGADDPENRTGLWIFDIQNKQATKVLSGQITTASWKQDRTGMAFSLGSPFHEIWVTPLDPNVSTSEALGPGQTLDDHFNEMLDYYTRRIEVDTQDAVSYLRRAQYSVYLKDREQVLADMDKYIAIIDPSVGMNSHDHSLRHLLSRLWWSTPTSLGSPVNTQFPDIDTYISSDGLSLYFTSSRYDSYGGWDIYVTTRETKDDEWGIPMNLGPPVNTSSYGEGGQCISTDGLSLFFMSNRPGGLGNCDIWVTTRPTKKAPWGEPVNLGPTVNSPYDEGSPELSADGLELYFSEWRACRPDGYGSSDLWVATRPTQDDPWGEPKNLGSTVNSPYYDSCQSLSADGLTLFFKSARPGGLGGIDLYVTSRKSRSDPWGPPMNLGPSINTLANDELPCLSADGSILYFTAFRPEGFGAGDIWQVEIKPTSGVLRETTDPNKKSVSVTYRDANEYFAFGPLVNLGSPINGSASYTAPSISSDGLSLFVDASRTDGCGSCDIWVAKRKTTYDSWGEPENLGSTVNSPDIEGNPDISKDGLFLFFESDRPGGHGGRDLWSTTRETENAPWSKPENMGSTINSRYREGHPSISADSLLLYFISDRPGSCGRDIWLSTRARTDAPWSEPVNLGPTVNSRAWDSAPSISGDGLMLFFESGRPGPFGVVQDIWLTIRTTVDTPWSEPVNLGPIVNSRFTEFTPFISADGSTLYFTSNQPGGLGSVDIWQVSITPKSGVFPESSDVELNRKSTKSND
jgi:serine/threonine protein kinase/Tol biopolymer transport system component/tetratricopeptide (TPR) repeat protein